MLTGKLSTLQDEDLALAKILQEQEAALLAVFASRGSSGENDPPAFSSGGGQGQTDEELAWRLMQEEEAAFNTRLLALAQGNNSLLEEEDERASQLTFDRQHDNDNDENDDENDNDTDAAGGLSYERLIALGELVGTVPTGLSAEQISSLPILKYGQYQNKHSPSNSSYKDEEQCVICRIEFEMEDEVMQLPCGHVYHPDCLTKWLESKKVCPHCSQEISATK